MELTKVVMDSIFGLIDAQEFTFTKQGINEIPENVFEAISIIFDPKYGESDMREFTRNREAYIEVYFDPVGDQFANENRQHCLRRKALDPQFITVNESQMEILDFHKKLENLGFLSCSTFDCLHLFDSSKVFRLSAFSDQDSWKLVQEIFSFHAISIWLSRESKSAENQRCQIEFTGKLGKIDDEATVAQSKIDKLEDNQEKAEIINALLKINLERREMQVEDLLAQNEIEQQQAQQSLENFDSTLPETSNYRRKLKEFEDFCNLNAARDHSPIFKTMDPARTAQNLLDQKIAADAKITGLFRELRTHLDQLTAKMNQKMEKENELTYFKYSRALLAVKTQNSDQYAELLRLVSQKIQTNEKTNRDYKNLEKSWIQEEKPTSPDVSGVHAEFQLQLGKMEANYRKMLELKIESLQLYREICENEKKIQELVPGAGVPWLIIQGIQKLREFIHFSDDLRLKENFNGFVFQLLNIHPNFEKKLWLGISSLLIGAAFKTKADLQKIAIAFKDSSFPIKLFSSEGFSVQGVKVPAVIEKKLKRASILIPTNSNHKEFLTNLLKNCAYVPSQEIFEKLRTQKTSLTLTTEGGTIAFKDGIFIQEDQNPRVNTSKIETLQQILALIEENCGLKQRKIENQQQVEKLDTLNETIYKKILQNGQKLQNSSNNRFKSHKKHLNLMNRLILERKIAGEVQGNINWNNLMENLKNVQEVPDQATFNILENELKERKAEFQVIQGKIDEISESMRTEFLELAKINQNLETHEISSEIYETFQKFNEKIRKLFEDAAETAKSGNIESDPLLLDPKRLGEMKLRLALAELDQKAQTLKKELENIQMKQEDEIVSYNRNAYAEFKELTVQEFWAKFEEVSEEVANQGFSSSEQNYKKLRKQIEQCQRIAQRNLKIQESETAGEVSPLHQKFIVAGLKDLMSIFESSCQLMAPDSVNKCKLFLSTHQNPQMEMTEMDEKFNLSMATAMKMKWIYKKDVAALAPTTVKSLEGFLLILNLIRYFSHLKFFVFDYRILMEFDLETRQKLLEFLNFFSEFVQILMVSRTVGGE